MALSGSFSQDNSSVVTDAPLYPGQDRGAFVSGPMGAVTAGVLIPKLQQGLQGLVNSLHDSCVAMYDTGGTTFSAITVLPNGQACVSYVGDSPVYMATRPLDRSGPWVVAMLNKGQLHEPGKDGREAATGRFIHLAPTVPGRKPCLGAVDGSRLTLAMTRSIGDGPFALSGHSHELTHLPVKIPEGHEAILIATSDGVSDARVVPTDPSFSEGDIAGVLNSDPECGCDVLARKIVARAHSLWGECFVRQAMLPIIKYYFASTRSLPSECDLESASKSELVGILKHIDGKDPGFLCRHYPGGLADCEKSWSSDDITAVCIRPEPGLVKMGFVLDGHGQANGAHVAQHCLARISADFPRVLSYATSACSEILADVGGVASVPMPSAALALSDNATEVRNVSVSSESFASYLSSNLEAGGSSSSPVVSACGDVMQPLLPKASPALALPFATATVVADPRQQSCCSCTIM